MTTIKLGADRIYLGTDALEVISELPVNTKRAFIVMSGQVLKETGALACLEGHLDKSGFESFSFFDVEPEPSFSTIKAGAEAMKDFKPDWIIGFGGGSAMDAAKAMWVYYENPEYKTLQDSLPPNQIVHLREKARLLCIPTSAGTGSEVTRATIVKDDETGIKHAIVDFKLRIIPDVAILDPTFTATMPKSLTAASGMDVITHAVESFVSTTRNTFSETMSIGAFINSFKYLPLAYEQEDNLEYREKMLSASAMGGIAFTNSGLGLCHSLAHSIGSEFGVPHGLANGIILPYIISFNSKEEKTREQYNELANLAGEDDLNSAIISLREKVDIPNTLGQVINDDKAFDLALEKIAKTALEDVNTKFSVIKPDLETMINLAKKCYYG